MNLLMREVRRLLIFFLHYFGVLWLITTQVKTSDFGVKGGRNGGVARWVGALLFLLVDRGTYSNPQISDRGISKILTLHTIKAPLLIFEHLRILLFGYV
jgi:hypothetical protein